MGGAGQLRVMHISAFIVYNSKGHVRYCPSPLFSFPPNIYEPHTSLQVMYEFYKSVCCAVYEYFKNIMFSTNYVETEYLTKISWWLRH